MDELNEKARELQVVIMLKEYMEGNILPIVQKEIDKLAEQVSDYDAKCNYGELKNEFLDKRNLYVKYLRKLMEFKNSIKHFIEGGI